MKEFIKAAAYWFLTGVFSSVGLTLVVLFPGWRYIGIALIALAGTMAFSSFSSARQIYGNRDTE